MDRDALHETLARVHAHLMSLRLPDGHWEGELSSSALATATAITALTLVDRHAHQALIRRGLDWLAAHQNADGGWGDTVISKTNISTTALVWAAFGAQTELADDLRATVTRAEAWLVREAGGVDPDILAPAIIRRYGKDRTFSVPILTTCALAGRLGSGREAWRWVIPLPFELAACPHRWFKWLRLPVVSYALPALIAIGQARYHHRPPRNPVTRLLRHMTRRRTLRILDGIQPESGGFLEAVPLTSFVLMSLASIGQSHHPVAVKGVEFLLRAAREDGSWAIDVDLATWVTTLAVNALAAGGEESVADPLPEADRAKLLEWLLAQQYKQEHPYTHAAPGAWAWTNLPGGVPDGDDTPGALLAIRNLANAERETRNAEQRSLSGTDHSLPGSAFRVPRSALPGDARCGKQGVLLTTVQAGIVWLLNLQNRDGGIPSFCRGWGFLPFDRSGADLTAHALRAWTAWLGDVSEPLRRRTEAAIRKALAYLARTQRPDGSWVPLWFGNQFLPTEENPTYGTARVVQGLTAARTFGGAAITEMLGRGISWLMGNQNDDGGWGGARSAPSTIEETALAVDALAGCLTDSNAERGTRNAERQSPGGPESFLTDSAFRVPRSALPSKASHCVCDEPSIRAAVERGVEWLIQRTDRGRSLLPSPIGFYFAKLWYFERLYPVVFALAALGRAARLE